MRDYGRIYCSFWTSANAQALSDDGRLLALYLLSCQHGTIAGACRLPDGYVCEDLKWTQERVRKGFDELFANGFANRCETTKWVWVCKHFEWNLPENPNQWKAARKIVLQIPDECAWKSEFLWNFAFVAGDPVPPKPNPSERVTQTVSEPVSVSVAVTVAETESKKVPTEPVAQERATDPPEPGPVEKVFTHWQQAHRKPKARLDDKRRALIRKALRHYGEADLCQAITGYLNSPHHMGQNPAATVYDSIELFLRDSQHIDAGLKFYAEPPRTDLSASTRRNVAAIADWKPPELRNAIT